MKLTVLRFIMIFLLVLFFRAITVFILDLFSMTDDAHEINLHLNKIIYNILDFPIGLFDPKKWSIGATILNTLIQSFLITLIAYNFKKIFRR